MDLAARRREYHSVGIDVPDMLPDPVEQFRVWLREAQEHDLLESEAFTVTTVGPDGTPSTRYVLLRGLDERGFAFFTNYRSAKARDIDAHPAVALTWGWLELHRQVRVTGTAVRLPASESDAYFASRPRGAQIGAWASPQSQVIGSRAELDALVAETEARFQGRGVPRPADWGGYLVAPRTVEFWKGRPNRLHDRLRYRREADGWAIERLAP